jgi:two-component system NtrC family sensor kinase
MRLLANESSFLSLNDNADLGLAWIDTEFRVVLHNSMMGRLCGNPAADLVGGYCYEVIRGRTSICPRCPGRQAMDARASVFPALEKDSSVGNNSGLSVHAIPSLADDGSVSGFLLVLQHHKPFKGLADSPPENEPASRRLNNEIADPLMIEKELQRQQPDQLKQHEDPDRLFRLVQLGKKEWELTMDCVKEIVVLVDAAGKIRRCNKAMVNLTGKGYPDLIGQQLRDVFRQGSIPVDILLGQQTEVFHELDGRWFLVNSYRLDESQDGGGAVLTLYDYTSLKQLTSKLEDSNRKLEIKSRQLEEAYAELKTTQVKIFNQEKMATIGQLAAGVAHEINNPIGFISSNLRTLHKYLARLREFIDVQDEALQAPWHPGALDAVVKARKKLKPDFIVEDVVDLIDESLDGAERVRKIVQDLKTFSRVDESDWRTVDLVGCFESTINMVWNEIKYKATLIRDFAELPPVRCYPHQVNQVFLNLLINAAQAIDKEGQITVKAWQDGETVLFSVADTGCGIPEENLPRIFEPFFTTKEIGIGTGLGLSLSYEIVKKHLGEIFVESEPGKGTAFTVRLPVDVKAVSRPADE